MRTLVLRTAGTNCDRETVQALRLAGSDVDLAHVNRVLSGEIPLGSFQMMVIPGGFSYGDDVAAGKILANELRSALREKLESFVRGGRIVIGICNGFQVLVKTGLLPGFDGGIDDKQSVTLTHNDSGRFQCQWIRLKREPSACAWLNGTATRWDLPIAHGEGKFVAISAKTLERLEKNKQVVFRYHGVNPNGSVNRIAGICNKAGNVVGLMPHPERNVSPFHHPDWQPGGSLEPGVGLSFFTSAVKFMNQGVTV